MAVITGVLALFAAAGATTMAPVFAIGALLDRIAPAQSGQPNANLRLNIGYALVHGWIVHPLEPIAGAAAIATVSACGGGLITLPDEGWALMGSAAVFFLATDFVEYLWHRAQHRVPLLWAMHSLHHSDPAVNVTTTTRHFWLETPLKAILVYPAVAIVFHVTPAIYVFYGVCKLYDFVQHLNLKAHFGPLWPVLNGPQFHRIHHSSRPEHCNRNFAHFFPVFDIIFGTHYRPMPGEYPATGLETGEVPTLLEATLWPLRRLWRPA